MDDEEDILFDQAGLISKRTKPMSRITGRPDEGRHKLLKTFLLCCAFFGLGLSMAIPGPTLKNLEERTNLKTGQVGMIFPARSVGHLVGSMFGGLMFDIFNQYLLLGFSLFCCGIGTTCAPWSTSLSLLIGFFSFQGVTMGFIDIGGNVLCVNMWGKGTGPYLQALHFSFGVGAFVSPLIAQPFFIQQNHTENVTLNTLTLTPPTSTIKPTVPPKSLKSNQNEKSSAAGKNHTKPVSGGRRNKRSRVPEEPGPLSMSTLQYDVNATSIVSPKPSSIQNATEMIKKTLKNMTLYQFAYLTIALFLIMLSFAFTCVCCCCERQIQAVKNQEIAEQVIRAEPRGFRVLVLVLLFIFFFLYVGMEITYGGYISRFAMERFQWSEKKAATLTAVFWGSFAVGRGLAIFFSRCLPPVTMLIVNLGITCFSLLGMVLTYKMGEWWIWTGSALLGVGLSSIFPTGIVWAERYLKITGKATSVFVVGSALGGMAMPALTGFVFNKKGHPWMLYILLTSAILSAIIYIIMQNLASNQGERYQKTRMAQMFSSNRREHDKLEMDTLSEDVFGPNQQTNRKKSGTAAEGSSSGITSNLNQRTSSFSKKGGGKLD